MIVHKKEHQELLEAFINVRDSKPLNKKAFKNVQELCLEEFDYIVQMHASRYKKFSNYEDLLQEGRISLLVALNSYAITKGSFYWWANHYIKTKLSREANKHSDVKIPLAIANDLIPMKVSIDNMFKEKEGSGEPLVDTQYDSKIISDMLKQFFETLDEKGKALISVTIEYGEASKKFDEICDEFGISKREGRKTLRVLREDLRQSLNNGEVRI